jgi:alpha-tubulin suppressor-like RCC1 family protein
LNAGFQGTSAIKCDGTLWTWGCNNNGQLGDGTTVNRFSPGNIVNESARWRIVSHGIKTTSAIKTDGTLWSWGYGDFGELGDGTAYTRSSPVQVFGCATNWRSICVGRSSSIAIKTDGTIWTWGQNSKGELGNGTTVSRCSPGTVSGGGNTWCFASSSSWFANSAVKTDGTLWTWGFNGSGSLGDLTAFTSRSSPGTTSGEFSNCNWCQISLGYEHSSSIRTDGTLWTWGCNGTGALGNNSIIGRSSPGTVVEDPVWCQVSGSYVNSSGIKSNGTLWTWGCNNCGLLGNGTTVSRCSPGTVAGGGTTWCQVSETSYFHTAAIKTDGTLWTWGRNDLGRLGDGTTVNRSSPGTIAGGGTNWCQVSSGFDHTAAIKTDGTLWTWGRNYAGVLGDGTTVNRSSPGTTSGGGINWCLVSSGRYMTSAVKTDGTLWTWGFNYAGRLGTGTTINRSSPGTTAGCGNTWCCVYDGYGSVLAIKTDGTLWTWGCNASGRLGDGTTIPRSSPGTVAGGGTTWCQVSSGFDSAIAVKTDGTLWTWGYNDKGHLGDGTTVSRSSPGTIAGGGTTWCKVGSGISHSLAIKTNGSLWSWGYNNRGELGDGTTVSRRSPGTIVSGSGYSWCQVSSGQKHTVAIKCNGTLWTWGCNIRGQLGTGTTVNRSSPGTTSGCGTNWCQVIAGYSFSAAIKTDGTLWTWGANNIGQLGNGTGGLGICRSSPGTVAGGGTTWCQVTGMFPLTSGFDTVAAVKTDGTLWTWGQNSASPEELLSGTQYYGEKNSPTTIIGGGTTWCFVSVGACHIAAIKSKGF